MDNHSKEQRSYNMSKIRSTSSKADEIMRNYLFYGFEIPKNDKYYVTKHNK